MTNTQISYTSDLLKLTDIVIEYSKSGKSDSEIMSMFENEKSSVVLDTVKSALTLSKII